MKVVLIKKNVVTVFKYLKLRYLNFNVISNHRGVCALVKLLIIKAALYSISHQILFSIESIVMYRKLITLVVLKFDSD